ncbi:L,D-transpeptidase family protein [Streptomyces sp. RKND-216]|uniref:L,D-transpeptidase family protein n=1 Tax=Streptomyces sp. RKND-216 TaxID=2562581 RepID=UPI001FF8A328|nr:L,D-transpeptidase family protein [Streptomyces sp. RKND-216]
MRTRPGSSRSTVPACHSRAAAAACTTAVALLLAGCGTGQDTPGGDRGSHTQDGGGEADATSGARHLPGVGARYRARIPEAAGQVVVVHGEGRDSARSRVELWARGGERDGGDEREGRGGTGAWSLEKRWQGHNGKRGWTTDHHEGDKRTPVGVFTLTDAGGVDAAPAGTALPYLHSAAFTPPAHWADRTEHDFDHVVAIDYNRVPGTSPLDPTRPRGQEKGGFIWLHLDHGSGTSGCVSVPRRAMEHLLRTLDPDRRPVIVMGDRATLRD